MSDGGDLAQMLSGARRRRRRRRIVWLLVLLIAAGGAAGWWYQDRTAAPVSAVTYVTDAVTEGALEVTVTATGSVQPTTEVDISSELSGTIAAISVDFNDTVAAGQELARLDTTKLAAEVATAEAQLTRAEAGLMQAEASVTEALTTLTAQQELDQRGVTTHQTLIAAQSAHDRAVAARAMAEAELRLARSSLELAEADLEKAVIRSPIDGVVLDRQAEAGQIVGGTSAASVLFTLAEDLTRMELQVDVDEADIGRVAAGQGATFTVDAFPGRSFPAEVMSVRFAPETTDGVVTYKAVLAVENAEALLRPGMTATATITVARTEGALTVPNAALRYAPPRVAPQGSGGPGGLAGLVMPSRPQEQAGTADGRSVWVLRAGSPVRVEVAIGDSDGSRTIVTSDDLAPGDEVITGQRSGGPG